LKQLRLTRYTTATVKQDLNFNSVKDSDADPTTVLHGGENWFQVSGYANS
jgi:hypothetical protein